MRDAYFKSVAVGVSLCSAIIGCLFILTKTEVYPFSPLAAILVGVIGGILLGALTFLVIHPTDKRVARRLDNEFKLGERAQTMIEFLREDGDMIRVQREDAEQRLLGIEERSLKLRHIGKTVACLVLCLGIMVTSFIIPAAEEPPAVTPPEESFELSDWQLTALTELIETVKASNMENVPKASVVSQLTGLLSSLKSTTTVNAMKSAVIKVITEINAIVRNANSCDELSAAFGDAAHSAVKSYEKPLSELNGVMLRDAMEAARQTMLDDGFKQLLEEFALALSEAVEDSAIPDSDPLAAAFIGFGASLDDILSRMDSYTVNWAQEKCDVAFTGATETVNSALLRQKNNKTVGSSTVHRLMDIFGIAESELPKEALPDNKNQGEDGEYDDKEDDDKPLEDGGYGSGEVVFGSDDMIYYPEEERYVSYGEVINLYYAMVSEKLMDGRVPESLQQFITDYFDILYDGSKKEN